MKWITSCLGKYAVFQGRSGIEECFVFLFFVFVCLTLGLGIDLFMGWEKENIVDWIKWYPTFELTRLVLLLPFMAVTARRLHDGDRSGWMALLWFVPVVGWAYLLMLLAQPGDEGANAHGPPLPEG
jgi:uncharacterized membrane protein YhaH (DUF805 family)